jgi:nitrite reductase (NADH) small subunit
MSQTEIRTENSEKTENAALEFTVPNGFGTENPALEVAFRIIDEAKPPKARQRGKIIVCAASEIAIGQKRIVTEPESGISIGVFNIGGEFFAIKNVCPHMGAPLCQGSVHGTHRPGDVFEFRPDLQGRVLRCPWHGWEFDILTGKGLYDAKSRVATYPCEINEDGDVVINV